MAIHVTSGVIAALLAEARGAGPLECCGLLFGDETMIERAQPAANVHPTPRTHFEIDAQALIDAHRSMRSGGPRLIGYYHSHPQGPPAPSATDRAMAAGDGMIWAIVGEGRVTLWRTDRDASPDVMTPLPIHTLDA